LAFFAVKYFLGEFARTQNILHFSFASRRKHVMIVFAEEMNAHLKLISPSRAGD
jgi:hypothetical protein